MPLGLAAGYFRGWWDDIVQWLVGTILNIPGLFLLLLPFLDRRAERGGRSTVFTWIGVGIIVYVIALTYLGYTASPTK